MMFVPDLTTLSAFFLAAVVLTITPGPDMTLFLGRTLSQGRAAGMASMLGASSGILVHTSLAAFGISALIAASPQAFLVLKVVGAAYLVFLAAQAIVSGSALNVKTGERKKAKSLFSHWLTGLGINLLNPKIILFFVTFLPQFVSASDPHAAGKLVFLGLFFILVAVPLSVPMILAAGSLANLLTRKPKVTRAIDWLFAGVFSAFAIRILFAQNR
ncbi:Lysine exporter protein (LYSE/YGGA) [Fulvimarina pelagi HTCC2506]|uniref:Lysine exporter protein (LYSE/YGGA) n=1 Tax=Fulvimarina pelagi HTCC2506 TaxID=314231 RepID=Q0G1X9_9HYPH|nr:LysE family translocator [Fulvimarina pelagi]EAU41419.1 Lysine exporter protein (LYSE/YGGA) [Fulvimarina pelagi HTCC2506]